MSDAKIESEIIIVDDNSDDGSVRTVLGLQNQGYNITYVEHWLGLSRHCYEHREHVTGKYIDL